MTNITAQKGSGVEYVYCGGRFDFDYQDEKYIEKAEQDYRAVLLKDVNLLLKSPSPIHISNRLIYVGPFYFETDGMLDQDIVETEIRQIENCTTAVFLLDGGSCPGTVAEMIYAASLNKKMIIAYLKDENETESALLSSCWYPIILCQKISGSTIKLLPFTHPSEGRKRILDYIRTEMV